VDQVDLRFGVTLWCKTLVLRKDKVTHCVKNQLIQLRTVQEEALGVTLPASNLAVR